MQWRVSVEALRAQRQTLWAGTAAHTCRAGPWARGLIQALWSCCCCCWFPRWQAHLGQRRHSWCAGAEECLVLPCWQPLCAGGVVSP